MRTGRRSTKSVVSVVALLLLGTTIIAVTQRPPSPVARTSVCVKDNGQMRMLTGGTVACDPSERQVELVTDVRVGSGLVASREDGLVNLAVDPSFLSTCAGCGRIFAGYGNDDLVGTIPVGPFIEQIAELQVPAGSYAVFAKLVLENDQGEGGAGRDVVRCRLAAGDDSDDADIAVEDPHVDPGNFQSGLNRIGLHLQVVHHFAAAGSITLSCGEITNVDPDVRFRHLKIIAVEAGSISNVFLGN